MPITGKSVPKAKRRAIASSTPGSQSIIRLIVAGFKVAGFEVTEFEVTEFETALI
jgi:hypothetical protein